MTPISRMATYVPHEVAARFGLHVEAHKDAPRDPHKP
jgi:hypothetical protein